MWRGARYYLSAWFDCAPLLLLRVRFFVLGYAGRAQNDCDFSITFLLGVRLRTAESVQSERNARNFELGIRNFELWISYYLIHSISGIDSSS